MKKILLLIMLSVFSFGNWLENKDWNESTNNRFNLFLGLQALDVASTYYVLKTKKGEEANPIYGKNPKIGTLLLGKVVLIPLIYASVNNLENTKHRNMLLNIVNVMYIGVTANNIAVGFNIKF